MSNRIAADMPLGSSKSAARSGEAESLTPTYEIGSTRRRVKWLLLAYAATTVCALAGVLAFLRTEAITSQGNQLGAFARLTAGNSSDVFGGIERALRSTEKSLSATIGARSLDAAHGDPIRSTLRGLREQRPGVRDFYVLDERGRIIAETSDGHVGLDASEESYFAQHRDHPGLEFDVGAPIKSEASGGQWTIPATLTLTRDSGEFAGVVVAMIEPLFFQQAWALDDGISNLTLVLTSSQGTLLMRSPWVASSMGSSFASGRFGSLISQNPILGTFQASISPDDENRLWAYQAIPTYPNLLIVVGKSMRDVLADWWRIVWISGVCWTVASVALGALAVWLGREWEAHRATEDRYRTLFSSNPYASTVTDRKTQRILAVNDAAIELYGWSREEFLSLTVRDFFLPQALPAVAAEQAELSPDSVRIIQNLQHRRKDGSVIDVEMAARLIEFNGEPAALTIIADVSERRRTEKARLTAEEQLRHSQKLEAVGQLTGGIAHDFNNILMVILANTDDLQEDKTLPGDVKDRIGRISKAVLRASDLTRQLLAFSRKQSLRPKHTNINDLVADTGKLLRRTLGDHIEIESVLSEELWTTNVDRAQLESALVNLCVNARDAMPAGGKLRIGTSNATLDGEFVARNPGSVAGDYVLLAVTDTGSGMPQDVLEKVFDPFFTTKDVGKGTGLGLSMVYGFIKQSNGHILVDSELGRGTCFCLYLPRSRRAPDATTGAVQEVTGGTERILVVEDDGDVRAGVVRQLQSLGYRVSQAADAEAGILAFETAAQPYDLLLTDIMMPGPLNGRGLADQVTRRWPTTKVVFMSGYAESAIVHDGKLEPGVLLLNKPFRRSDLAQIIHLALGRTGGPEKSSEAARHVVA